MTLRLSLASHFLYACALAQTPTKQDALGYSGVASHRSLTRRFPCLAVGVESAKTTARNTHASNAPIEDKESYKWEHASERTAERFGATMARTISVCDREFDVYEYLDYKLRHAQRFVIRAKVDRRVLHSADEARQVVRSRAALAH